MTTVATPPPRPRLEPTAVTQAATGACVLAVSDLAKRYAGTAADVFSGISFRVHAGERVAVLGANGSGKTTLMRCCLGLLRPDAGSIHLHGDDLATCGARDLRRLRAGVGMVFQKHQLVPRLSVLSNVLHGSLARGRGPRAWYQGWARSEDRAYALHCLDRVGLADLAARRADALSGGQSQRVAIARALMQQPRVLFADEPAASLDPRAGDEVMGLFADLARDEGLTLIFVTHHLDHARTHAQRILGLRQGRLVLDATAAQHDEADLRMLFQ